MVSWLKVGFAVLTFALAGHARTGMMDGLGTWQGSGTVFGADGEESGSFTIELTRSAVSAGVVEARGKVTMDSGEVVPIQQRMTVSGAKFRVESNHGKGGGYCFGQGLCQSYEDAGGGHGYATTIIVDAPDKLRVLVTELNQGRPLRFIRQNLTKRS